MNLQHELFRERDGAQECFNKLMAYLDRAIREENSEMEREYLRQIPSLLDILNDIGRRLAESAQNL
jgi:hypothetical protein